MAKFSTTISCIKSMVAAVKASPVFALAVAAAFPGKTLLFWIGHDEKQKPPVSSAPYVALMPDNFGRNQERTQNDHGVLIALVVADGSVDVVDGVTTYGGLEKVELLSRAFDAAISEWIKTNFAGIDGKTPFRTATELPAHKSVWSYTFPDQI